MSTERERYELPPDLADAAAGRERASLLCPLGMHASRYGDGCKCWSASRCNRCHTSRDPQDAARVDECRRLVGAGQHPDGPCQGGVGRGF